jgi:hypothetical protein
MESSHGDAQSECKEEQRFHGTITQVVKQIERQCHSVRTPNASASVVRCALTPPAQTYNTERDFATGDVQSAILAIRQWQRKFYVPSRAA